MIVGLYLIITSWVVPGLPLWFSIVNTTLGVISSINSIVTAMAKNIK